MLFFLLALRRPARSLQVGVGLVRTQVSPSGAGPPAGGRVGPGAGFVCKSPTPPFFNLYFTREVSGRIKEIILLNRPGQIQQQK